MLYRLLQWISGIALHWYYRDIEIVHRERIPTTGPILVAVNHQNALVDAIVAQWVVPRRLQLTAKATLVDTTLGALFMNAVGVIPLRRTSDETPGLSDGKPQMHNRHAFRRIIEALRHGGAILIFPEGKSHNDAALLPLKTGLARVALRARDAGVQGLHIVPIGLTFADKAHPDTVVVAQVGEVLAVDEWPTDDPQALTATIEDRLRTVAFTVVSTHVLEHSFPVSAGTPPYWLATRLITFAAWWGRTAHKFPIVAARRLALTHSATEDEPAMYTMVYGLAFTLVAYAIQIPLVWWFLGGWVALLYFMFLLIGAYWAAYAPHTVPQPKSASTA